MRLHYLFAWFPLGCATAQFGFKKDEFVSGFGSIQQ